VATTAGRPSAADARGRALDQWQRALPLPLRPRQPHQLGDRRVTAIRETQKATHGVIADTRAVGQATGLVWGTVGILSSLNKASKAIVKRSIAKAEGRPIPKEFDDASRTNNAMIFIGGLAGTVIKAPRAALALSATFESIGAELVAGAGIGAASFAGVGKIRQLLTDMRSTYDQARLNRLPFGKLAIESIKEATGWNRIRGQESAILEPLPEKVLLIRLPAGRG